MDALEFCEDFAKRHKVIFDSEGECGFGRACVGIRHGDTWVAFDPRDSVELEVIPEFDSKGMADPPDGVANYHKHDCLAVLGHGQDAVSQLATWLKAMEDRGVVSFETYPTGVTGIQAMFSGVVAKCVVVRPR